MSKYAIYVVIVEDTEADDMAVMSRTPGAEAIERLAGNLNMEEATDIVADMQVDYGNTDIAR